jgi:hypothetical protein
MTLRRLAPLFLLSLTSLALAACGSSARTNLEVDGSVIPTPDAAPPLCTEGAKQCNNTTLQTCTGGTWVTTQDCLVACDATYGCVACKPGSTFCKDGDVYQCDAMGNPGGLSMACTGSNVCENGACVDACQAAITNKSYEGCEYWAVDLDNAVEVLDYPGGLSCFTGSTVQSLKVCEDFFGTLGGLCDAVTDGCPSGFTCYTDSVCVLDAEHSPFAIVVSNPQARAVDVTLTSATGVTKMLTVPAGQVSAIQPQALGLTDQSIDGTGKTKQAYKVTSTLPIVAYQFNPLDNSNVFSNDASLLIPRTAFDTDYYVMSYKTLDRSSDPFAPTNDYHGYLTVVAWQDGTQVEVTPTAAIIAGPGQAALPANVPHTFTLNAFEVLNLEAGKVGDLTGSRVRAPAGQTTTFGVFGGHEATNVLSANDLTPDATHTAGPCCADHLEEMMFGTSTWGKSFTLARSAVRASEHDTLRIMAQKPNTTLTITPAPTVGTCGTLDAGKFCEIEINGDTSITSTEPVLVGHYLQSAIWQVPGTSDSVGDGDPSLSIVVPTEQFRNNYTVLVPAAYTKNYLSIAAPANGAISVDGTDVSGMLTVFAGSYRAARIAVQPGQHTIACPGGCGVEVYGYSDAVSYLFAGGLDLKSIVIN